MTQYSPWVWVWSKRHGNPVLARFVRRSGTWTTWATTHGTINIQGTPEMFNTQHECAWDAFSKLLTSMDNQADRNGTVGKRALWSLGCAAHQYRAAVIAEMDRIREAAKVEAMR
jgi:hypothetical protein